MSNTDPINDSEFTARRHDACGTTLVPITDPDDIATLVGRGFDPAEWAECPRCNVMV